MPADQVLMRKDCLVTSTELQRTGLCVTSAFPQLQIVKACTIKYLFMKLENASLEDQIMHSTLFNPAILINLFQTSLSWESVKKVVGLQLQIVLKEKDYLSPFQAWAWHQNINLAYA